VITGDVSYLPSPLPTPVPETVIAISPTSTRLELLAPFAPHFSEAAFADPSIPLEFADLRCLVRIRGKCTTDEISAAGAWLKYKGHLSNIRFVHFLSHAFPNRHVDEHWIKPNNSENTLIGATNDENGQINLVKDFLPNEAEGTIPEMAKRFKARDQPWMIVTDVSLITLLRLRRATADLQ
jgi:aconitase A